MPSIIWTPSPLFKGAVNFNYLPREKGFGSIYSAVAGPFGWGWHFTYFCQGLSFLNLEITLFFAKLCYGMLP